MLVSAKQKTLAIGVYPTVGLKEAREAREQAKPKAVQRSIVGPMKWGDFRFSSLEVSESMGSNPN
ncbi:Arm DNA-binding domain-containing protein, partial [Methylosinus sp. Ce-a6]|uniref:Arm DNA-binding domain-containing protein n=1 Tax=Methylosinus sp. Ce-a6 TaxID=2172005 RepID=UPI001FCECDC6